MFIQRLPVLILLAFGSGSQDGSVFISRMQNEPTNLASKAMDKSVDSLERERALTGLMQLNFSKALEIAPSLLADKEEPIRFRAAWILADSGRESGAQVLRTMAADSSSELSTLGARALGRLRDDGSHQLLRDLLEAELANPDRHKSLPRVSALVSSLSDYSDAADAPSISRAIERYLDLGADWLEADELGRTGGRAGVPVLRDIFSKRGKGWAVMSAGLGLARCGSEEGKKYVSERLTDTRCCRAPHGTPSDAFKDDPFGPEATSFILDHMGLPVDEIFVPGLTRIVSSADFSDTAKAQAWVALSRIDSTKYRPQLLELAWKNIGHDGAARLIVLNDESRVRALQQSTQGRSAMQTSHALETALAASPRERRRWRETRGYAF